MRLSNFLQFVSVHQFISLTILLLLLTTNLTTNAARRRLGASTQRKKYANEKLSTISTRKYGVNEVVDGGGTVTKKGGIVRTTAEVQQQHELRTFCLGTENGRNTISVVRGMGHYERLRKSYVRCRRVIGNLELTHVDARDVRRDERRQRNQTAADKDKEDAYYARAPFYFLEHLEEITGYLFIFNINLTEISLPKLRIIWGEKLHEGNALQIDSNPGMEVLNLPALRTIERGNLSLKRSANLCYMDPNREYIRYSEILGPEQQQRLNFAGNFNPKCARAKPCHKNCGENCFGTGADKCQNVYRKMCSHCESGCFKDAKDGALKCCDDACAGGCTGEGTNKCIACKKFEQDGRCVTDCRGFDRYDPAEKRMDVLPEAERRFAYGRHCVPSCPSGSLYEGSHCVTRCTPGKYRNGTDHCVLCQGECPKVCQLEAPINSVNIRELINCTEIEGNIEILNHVFSEHIPTTATIHSQEGLMGADALIPAINVTQLNVLRSVQIVTGFVVVDGGRMKNKRKLTSLEFLSNLKVIEGRKLYFEKFALYVIGNMELTRLGLRSLKRIKNGIVSVRENRLLCYSYTIPFEQYFGIRESAWSDNMNESLCVANNRVCSQTCDAQLGCWGKESKDCVRCRNYTMEGNVCAEQCQTAKGHYIVEPYGDDPLRRCLRCHEQCMECHGPSSGQCSKCRSFHLWRNAAQTSADIPYAVAGTSGAVRHCVAKCPNMTYPEGDYCVPCHKTCRSGCSGPSERVGPGGCNQCLYALEGERLGEYFCLFGDEPEKAVCGEKNGLPDNYFITLAASSSSITKFLCRKCRPECNSCFGDGVQILEQSVCQCAFYQMALFDRDAGKPTECTSECGKGSRVIIPRSVDNRNNNNDTNETAPIIGLCQQCHPLCDPHFSCAGPSATECDRCSVGGVSDIQNGTFQCLAECPHELPFPHEGICYEQNIEEHRQQRTRRYIALAVFIFFTVAFVIAFLIYRCLTYQKKYTKEVQMHLPEIPSIDPMKVTQRPNMRRIHLIQINELEFAPEKRAILGQGAFGIVYAGKWKPPSVSQYIPVAIKAINCAESRNVNEKEMLHEAGLMHAVKHEHLLPVAGICMGATGGLKIVTLLRPLGSLLKFMQENEKLLGSKHLMLYCFQISSAMEYLANKKIVHRDLAARNVLVRSVIHVEVTDFGLAAMLQQPGDSVIVDGRVAVKWLALESLRRQIYNQKTDVWSFGVTCWEILTFGESPYRDLQLKREKLASELAYELERGYRLRQPTNCSQELYQELLNCWLVDPDSRPNFLLIKQRFEQFCRAPHIYIQDRQANQRLNSLLDTDQRAMIERLLRDNDFLDPVGLDPAEYCSSWLQRAAHAAGCDAPDDDAMHANARRISVHTMSTECCFSASPPPLPTCDVPDARAFAPRSRNAPCHRLGSTGTGSTRYKSDPVGRKWSQSTTGGGSARNGEEDDEDADQDVGSGGGDDEVHYLMPKRTKSAERRGSITSDNGTTTVGNTTVAGGTDTVGARVSELYTPVVEAENLPNYINDVPQAVLEYANGSVPVPNNYENTPKAYSATAVATKCQSETVM
uniref:receptor protein-tyrosine kinase n=1 Tax=Globodera pallida TaxID=36090 RepID=A0A183C6L3_GLOPA